MIAVINVNNHDNNSNINNNNNNSINRLNQFDLRSVQSLSYSRVVASRGVKVEVITRNRRSLRALLFLMS